MVTGEARARGEAVSATVQGKLRTAVVKYMWIDELNK